MNYTVGKLAKHFGLSRSALLYYDTIGLLKPAHHIPGEYRIYDEGNKNRLAQICTYRKAGIALDEIQKILDSPETTFTSVLQDRFEELNGEILRLHEQQRIIADLLQNREMLKDSEVMTKERWVAILQSSGYGEDDMRRWHVHFERTDPKKHHIFLRFLQIEDREIEEIRSWADDQIK